MRGVRKKACLFVLLRSFYSVAAKFCLKSKVQPINLAMAAVLHLSCPYMAEFQKCSQ